MRQQESFPIKKVRCPKCHEAGKDTRGDNLALYSDGHQYCFGCGYFVHGARNLIYSPPTRVDKPQDHFYIPDDAGPDLPFEIHEWLFKINRITYEDLIDNKILWSNKHQWLIFPIEIDGVSQGFQARNFNKIKPYKWYTKFPKKGVMKVYGLRKVYDPHIVIVEDIISAIRVGHFKQCMPLFGSSFSDELILKLQKTGFTNQIIWLDADKYKESLMYSIRSRELGQASRIIHTELDPKAYSDEELKHFLGVA